MIALGDSLTAGDGDESGSGYVGRLTESIGAMPGRSGSSLVNLGASGWDSTMMVDGQEGTPSELGAALAEVEAAVAEGRAVLATVLIGSNDMWYLYEYGPAEGTPAADEDAAAETYRDNLDRTVSELSAGRSGGGRRASRRPVRPTRRGRHRSAAQLPARGHRRGGPARCRRWPNAWGGSTEEVAAAHGVRTVDTNAPFWSDVTKMADDGIHPNGDGYADLAALWLAAIHDLL